MKAVDITELAAAYEVRPPVVEAVKNVRQSMYFVCSFRNVVFWKLAEEQELTHGASFLGSVGLVVSDVPCSTRIACEDGSPYDDVLTFEAIADVAELCKTVMSHMAHDHRSCSAFHFS